MAGKGIDFPINPTIDKKSLENQVNKAVKSGAEKGIKEGTSKGIKEGLKGQLPSAARAITETFSKVGQGLERGSKGVLDAASALDAAASKFTKAASQARAHQPKITPGIAEAGITRRQREVASIKRSQQSAGSSFGPALQKAIDKLTSEIIALKSSISQAKGAGERRFEHPTTDLRGVKKSDPGIEKPAPKARKEPISAEPVYTRRREPPRARDTAISADTQRRAKVAGVVPTRGAYVDPYAKTPAITARPKSKMPCPSITSSSPEELLLKSLGSSKIDLKKVVSGLPREQRGVAAKAAGKATEAEEIKKEQSSILRELQKSTLSAKQRASLEDGLINIVKLYRKVYNEAVDATKELAKLRKKEVQIEKAQANKPTLRKKTPAGSAPPVRQETALAGIDKQLAELNKPIKSAQRAVQRLSPDDASEGAAEKRRRAAELVQDRQRLQAQRKSQLEEKSAVSGVLGVNVPQGAISRGPPQDDLSARAGRGRPSHKDFIPEQPLSRVQELGKEAKSYKGRASVLEAGNEKKAASQAREAASVIESKRQEIIKHYAEIAASSRKEASVSKKTSTAESKRAQAKVISKGPPEEDVAGKGGRNEAAILREIIEVRQRYKDSISEHIASSVQSLSRMAASDRRLAQLAEATLKTRGKVSGGAGGRVPPGGPAPPPGPPGGPPHTDEEFQRSAYSQFARAQSTEKSRKEAEGKTYTREDLTKAAAGISAGGGGAAGAPPPGGVPPGGGGGPTEPPVGEWVGSIQRMWAAITSSLKEAPEKIAKLDASAIFKATPYRELAGRHTQEVSKEFPAGVKGPKEIETQFRKIQTSTSGKMNDLITHLRELARVAGDTGTAPSSGVASALSEIKALTSKAEGGVQVEGGKEEVKKYERATEKFVRGALKKIIASLLAKNKEIEKAIIKAAKAGKSSKVEGLAQDFALNVGEMERIYTASERSGAGFNVNRQRDTRDKSFSPGSPIAEAQFRYQDVAGRNASKELKKEGLDTANEAAEAARNFKGMADEAKRIKAALDALFAKATPDSLEFRKNLTGVIERLKRQSSEGIIDRAEVESTIKTLEQYASQVRNLRLGEVGLRKAGPTVIPSVFEQAAPGGSQKEFLRQIEKQRQEVARGPTKASARVELFQFQDQSGAIRKMQVEYRKLGGTLDSVAVKAKELGRMMSARDQFGLAFRRVAMWGAAAGLTYGAISAFRDAISTMVEAEVGVVSLSKVMEEADFNFKAFTLTVNNFVQNTTQKFAASMKDAYDVMRIFAQQGKNMADTMSLTEASFLGANISILTQKDVAEALTATTKQFNIEASKSGSILDAWNEVSNRNAVTMKTLADATKKAGAAAKVVGVEFEQFLGLVTAVSEATRQPGKEIGTSLRFIFQRTLRPETQKELARVGLSTTDLQGNFKGFIPVITELADRWDTLTRSQRLSIAQALGGARQYNVFLALMGNFDTAVKASTEAVNSQGSAQRENTKYMQTAAASMKKAKAAVDAMYVSMGSTLLPVVKTLSESVVGLAKAFQGIPNWAKAATASMLVFAVAGTRVASSLDYVMMSGGATTAGAGIGSVVAGGILGRGKTPEQLAALPIEKQAALRPAGRIGKGITDMGYVGIGAGGIGRGTSEIGSKLTAQGHQLRKLDTSWAAVNSGVQKGLKGSATWVDHNTTKMSKLNAVVRGYGVQAAGSTSTAALGMQALNSPISLAIALFANLTKGIAIFGIKLVAFLPGLIASMTGLGKATLATGKAFAVAQIRALGLFGTVALAAALGTAIYLIYDALSDVGKASHKTHGQIAKDFESQIAKGQKSLRQSSAELASLKRIESQRRKMIKLNEMSSEKKRAGIEQGVYKSALINALKFDELQQKAGASVAKVDPAAIESIDKYGRVILDTSKSMISLANASVAAQAQLVAFYKTKVAVAAAVETNTAFKNLEKAVKDYSDVLPLLKSRSNIFGQFAGYSEEIDKLGTSLIKAQHDFTVIMKVLQDTLGGLPPSTPIESFVSALGNTKILKAFASEAERVNTVLKEQGQAAGTAGDLMNKLFLKSKGFKNVGITGQVTAESFHSHRLLGRSIEQIDRELKEGKQVLKGKELITFGPEGPFGLTQARLFIDDAGKYMVQGINKAGVSITRTLSEVSQLVGKDSGALVFDPTVLVQQFNTSIAKARKILGGAGAGLIKFPAQLDLGVKFKFQLGNLEYLQSAGTDIADMITRVAVAQQAYGKTLGEFEKSAKQNPTGKRASDQLNNLNDTARMIAQSTFFVTLASEISNLGKAAEKAAYEMSTANLQDAVSQQFAALTTSAKGFSADLVFKLPKLGSQLSSVEKVTQSNPDIARSIKASDRALAVVEAQAKSFASTLQVDIPKIFEESGPSDLKRFFDKADQDRKSTAKNLRRYGDDKKAAAFGQDIQKVESAVLTQTKVLGEKLDTLAGKGKSDKREVITKLKFDPSIIDKFTRGIAERGRREDIGPFFRRMEDTAKKIRIEQAEEVRKRAKKNLGRATKDKTGRVDVSNVSTKKLYIEAAELARSQGKDFSYEQGRQIKERTVKGQQYALAQAVKSALVDTREEDKSTRGIIAKGFGIFSSDIGRAFEKEWWTPFRRSLPSIDTLGIAGSEYGTKERISTTANKKLISGLASNLSALRDTPVSEFQKIGQAFLDKQIKSYVKPGGKSITSEEDIARSNKSILSALSNYRPAMKALIDTTWKELKVQNEALKAITLVAVANKDFASSLTKSLKGIISFGKQLKALGSLTAPLVGAGAGIPKGRIDIGKSHGELGAYERLYKKFPGFVGSLTRQEQLRQKTLSELPGIYQKMEVSQQKLKEVSQYVTNPTQRTNLTRLGALSDTMFSQLANSVKNMNTQLRPLIKSFAEMQRLEQISKNIEDIVKALKKAEDLDFDTASIDKALGRHPLSPTAGVFGQPAGLNKFERERFVLDQKRRAGTIGGGAYGLERKKIDFGREEALIQYKQSKENTKLSQEVDAAKRAMGLLWDAQYQGIGGLQPMIDTIKSELSTAGDVTDIGGKREFQGIPSLQGLQKEIAKVQQQKRALNYRQQRDIVMGETERLLSKIHDLMKEQTKAVAQAEKDITGAEGVGGIEARIKAFNTALSSTTKALLSMLSAVQKPTGTAGAGAEAGRLAILNTKFADTMKAAGDSFKLGTDDYKKAVQDFVKAAANLSRSTESRATRHKGEKVLATTDKGPTGFATGGYIKGSPGLDTIDTNLPVGGFVMSRPAVQKHGLSKLNRMQSAVSSGNFSSSSIPAKVTTGEFVFGPQAVNSIGVGGLTSLNRGAGDGSGRFGKGGSVGTGRFNKNLLLDTFSSTDEKKSDINIRDKRVRNVMTLEGLRAIQAITGNKKLSTEKRLKLLDEVYNSSKYRKEIVEPAKKRDDELLAEQLGRGGGYIKVGDRYVAFGRANLVDEGLKSRSRLPALKKKYEDLRRGAASKEDLRKLAFGISPSKLNTVEDGIFVKALRSGSTPEEFKKRIKDSVTIHKGKDDTLSLEGEAREYQSIKSLHALGAFATTSKFTGEIRREALIESLKGLTSASSKHKRVGAYRDFILTQKAGSQKLLEKRTNMAALLALLSKTGRVPGVYGAWQSDELQRVATTGGVIKANPSIDFNGEKVPLALWTNPKTSKSFMVDARRIGKDGTYSESIRQDDVGDYYYSGFKLPVDLATSSFIKSTEKGKKDTIFDVGRVFLERTGGTKAVASGGGSGIGVVDIRKTLGTFKDTGEISFSSKFLRDEKLPDYTMRERLERAGTTSSAGRFFGAAALSLAGIPAGLAKMGKGVGKGIYEGDIEKIYGSSLFGLTKGVGQTAADLGIVDAPEYGLEAKRTSALYGIAGRGVRGLRGKKDLGGYEATAEGLASTVVEGGLALIPAIGKLGKLGKVAGRGLKSLKTKFGRKALAGLDAAGVQKGTLSKASLEGFAKKYEGVGDLSSLELLKQGRTTAYRAGLRGVSKLGGTGEKIASVLSPRRRLIAERKRALELGLDPSSRFVSRRGYREARKILETGEKTGLSRSRLSQKFISPKKLAGEVLAGKDKFTGRTTRAQRKASEALAKKRGLDLTLAEGKEGLATRQKALIEAGYSKSKRKLTFTRPGSSLLDRIRDLFGRKDSDIKYGGLSTGKQLGFDFDVPGIKAKSKASGVVSGAIDIPSTSLSKTTPIGKTAQRGRVSLSPSFERQVVRSKVAASKTEKFFDSASKKGISREEAAPFLQRYLKGSSLNEIFADLVLARKVRSVGFSTPLTSVKQAIRKYGLSSSDASPFLDAAFRGADPKKLISIIKRTADYKDFIGLQKSPNAPIFSRTGSTSLKQGLVYPTGPIKSHRKAYIGKGSKRGKAFTKRDLLVLLGKEQPIRRSIIRDELATPVAMIHQKKSFSKGGNRLDYFASGGFVSGSGGPKSDSIPARLSNGEYVIPADVVSKYGTAAFDALRDGKTGVKGFKFGGAVGNAVESGALSSPLDFSVLVSAISTLGDKISSGITEAFITKKETEVPASKTLPAVRPQDIPTGPGSGMYAEPIKTKGSVEGQSGALSGITDVFKTAANSFKSAITDALKEAKVVISEESIQSVSAAVRKGVEDGSGSIETAIKNASPSTAGGVTGLGAAVRPAEFEALQGRVEILNEKLDNATVSMDDNILDKISTATSDLKTNIQNQWNQDQTDLNERFSSIKDEVSFTIRNEFNPKINTNTETIAGVDHLAKTLQSLVHSVLAKVGNQ